MNITVFCGARFGDDPAFERVTRELGTWIAEQGHTLIYGAGGVGLMGVVSSAALDAGGEVIGAMPGFLVEREMSRDDLGELCVTETMSERKDLLITRSDAFIAMPGGQGTYEEVADVLSLAKTAYDRRPVILFNVNGFFEPLMKAYETLVDHGFALPDEFEHVHLASSVAEVERILGKS